jgi:hypothetical protein
MNTRGSMSLLLAILDSVVDSVSPQGVVQPGAILLGVPIEAAADGEVHHARVAAVRRTAQLPRGVQEAKKVIDAVTAAYAAEEKDERQ